MSEPEITIENHRDGDEGEYRITVDGQAAGELTWTEVQGRRVLEHTGVREAFEGQGLAGKVVRRALDDARSEQISVVPLCPYVAAYIGRHPADADLVDAELTETLQRQRRSE